MASSIWRPKYRQKYVGSINRGRVELRFIDAKLKRHSRFTSDLVEVCGRPVPNGMTIFSRMRAPIRPLRHAEGRREVNQRSPRYPPRSLRRSEMADDIDAKFCELREDCMCNVSAEFRAHTTLRSNFPAFRRAPNLMSKPGVTKTGG